MPAARLILALICAPLVGCSLPDRWAAGYSYQPASGALPAREIYSVGVSGPLLPHRDVPAAIARHKEEEEAP